MPTRGGRGADAPNLTAIIWRIVGSGVEKEGVADGATQQPLGQNALLMQTHALSARPRRGLTRLGRLAAILLLAQFCAMWGAFSHPRADDQDWPAPLDREPASVMLPLLDAQGRLEPSARATAVLPRCTRSCSLPLAARPARDVADEPVCSAGSRWRGRASPASPRRSGIVRWLVPDAGARQPAWLDPVPPATAASRRDRRRVRRVSTPMPAGVGRAVSASAVRRALDRAPVYRELVRLGYGRCGGR